MRDNQILIFFYTFISSLINNLFNIFLHYFINILSINGISISLLFCLYIKIYLVLKIILHIRYYLPRQRYIINIIIINLIKFKIYIKR
jgi:hypothetical protein